jgi:hypothetical protein
MRLCLFASATVFLSALSFAGPPQIETDQADSKEKNTSLWMEKKMEYSQALLRALATGSHADIGENARQIRLLSKVEGFVRSKKPGYREHLRTFERACGDLILHSDNENLAGVTLAFNQLTISCVECHQTLRTVPDEAESDGTQSGELGTSQAD